MSELWRNGMKAAVHALNDHQAMAMQSRRVQYEARIRLLELSGRLYLLAKDTAGLSDAQRMIVRQLAEDAADDATFLGG